MKIKDLNKKLIEGIVLMLLSSFFISESLKLRGEETLSLSPALFPIIITVSLLVFSIILTIRAIKENRTNAERDINIKDSNKENSDIKQVILVMLTSFVYLLIISRVHFIISSIIYLLSLLLILGERRWKVVVSISIITPILIFFIFTNLLKVLLP